MKKFHQVNIREKLRSSYWFIPTLMTGVEIALSFVTHMLDVASESGAIKRLDWAWFYTGGPEGALTLLSTVAQSMITVAVTAFSVTLVALSLASQQFGPRVLRNFMQDMSYQVVLGTFIATFIYCLLVLRTFQPMLPATLRRSLLTECCLPPCSRGLEPLLLRSFPEVFGLLKVTSVYSQ